MVTEEVFKIAFVCTGNRCRSPYAAARLQALAHGLPVTVHSEGTLDSPGHRSPPELVEIAGARDVLLQEHRARPIATGSLKSYDLVIGFSFEHVASSVVDAGAERGSTFTLPELARLLIEAEKPADLDTVERAREMVKRADAKRDRSKITREELADPFGGPRIAYEQMADEIDGHLRVVARRLLGVDV